MLIADEPTTALDVTIQRQILDLMLKLCKETGAGIILIPHDVSVVSETCDRVVVMYAGREVESGPTHQIFQHARHPYTQALLSTVPKARWDSDGIEPIELEGEVPSPINLLTGCYFSPRCPYAMEKYFQSSPGLSEIAKGHRAACFLVENQTPEIAF